MPFADVVISDGTLSLFGVICSALVAVIGVQWRHIVKNTEDRLADLKADREVTRRLLRECLNRPICSCGQTGAERRPEADEPTNDEEQDNAPHSGFA